VEKEVKYIMKKNLKYYLIGIILTISLIFSAGCSFITISGNKQTTTEFTVSPATTTPTPSWTIPVTTSMTATSISQAPNSYPNFVYIVAKVKPSVVAINVELISYDIFGRAYPEEGAGSGWILDPNGLIATNNHVIDGATNIMVTLEDGTVLSASVVGADSISDLAVLKVDKTGLTAAIVGNSSSLQVGEWVLAIGNALGEGISATEGIVSRSGASITTDSGTTLYDCIQTSAAVNPGNSGGPLVNMAGEVVGITSAKLADVGVEGMGYAISIKTALPIIESLVQKGYVTRSYLGVQMDTVSQWYRRYNLAVSTGAIVTEVSTQTPADIAGLKAGDVIVNLNGKDITTAEEAQQAIYSAQIGDTVQIIYWRGNTKYTTKATLIESPAPSTTS
jgi:serine protease Do